MEGPTWFSWWGDADWVVRGVFIVLVGMSLASWTAIFYKARQFARLLKAERTLARHLDAAAAGGGPHPPLDRHAVPSRALFALHSSAIPAAALEGRIGHALRETRVELESGLSLLATIGNTAPFVGLLGTVWGIMHALQGLSAETALSLAMVGGPVAEALVATAAGLFAAIPAVMGYNYLLRQLGRLMMALEGNARRLAAQPSGLRLVEAR